MMSTKRFGMSLLPLLTVIGGSLYGGLVAPESLVRLQRNADLIVVGSTASATQSGAAVDFSLQVSRVVKGDRMLTATPLTAHWVGGHLATIGSGDRADVSVGGIWFLQRAANSWRVIPVVQGNVGFSQLCFPAPIGPISDAYAYSETATAGDKLASEIAAAIEQQGSSEFSLYALQVAGLEDLKSPVWGTLYQRMANSASGERKILGLSGLIRSGNAAALSSAGATAASIGDHPAQGILLLSIRDSLRPTDPDSVAAIGRAATATSQSVAFREAAAHALAAIHTPRALPFLAILLDDPNQNLRIEGIGGMAAFANGLAVQTNAGVPGLAHLQLPEKAPYKTPETVAHLAFGRQAIAPHEASYLSYWKTWWAENRASLGY